LSAASSARPRSSLRRSKPARPGGNAITPFRFSAALGLAAALTALSAVAPAARAQDSAPAPAHTAPLPHVLIVGGGPDPLNNQAAIESNVRYVSHLLPPGTIRRILFADGRPWTKNVLYEDQNGEHFRASRLGNIDGASRLAPLHKALLAVTPNSGDPAPLLLYFTGHGSPSKKNYDNNRYDLWGKEELSVARLSGEISALPKALPVTVVMVQCFSGAFGNLIFEGGAPTGDLASRTICGFFASLAPRPAAGCTPEIDESDYHDFTSYFFAALTGMSRLGKPVAGADYNHDGVVGMDEAYAYTLIHDDSIDTPVCTSDVFLRRYVKASEAEIFRTPWTELRSWATPAQVAALDGLSENLKLTGDDRLGRAYARFHGIRTQSEEPADVHMIRLVRLAKSVALAHLLPTTASPAMQERYAALVHAESANPLARTVSPADPAAQNISGEKP
jgi:hypothetical protein